MASRTSEENKPHSVEGNTHNPVQPQRGGQSHLLALWCLLPRAMPVGGEGVSRLWGLKVLLSLNSWEIGQGNQTIFDAFLIQ